MSADPYSDLDRILDRVPALSGRRHVEELSGGLTNRNYRVSTDGGEFVVRRSAPGATLLRINRDHEHLNSVAAATAGVGADVIAYVPDEHVLVVAYIDGQTFTDASFDVPGNVERVARACRQLHDGPRFVSEFNMFHVQRRYLSVVREHRFRLPPRYLEFAPHVARMQQALAVRDDATVPCNNDLLAANFIDDGAKIWIIDYEYSGNNDACFELGNIGSECHLDRDQLHALVDTYYGRAWHNKRARAQLLGLLGQYGWTLWASIQHASSRLDFDFWSWGMEKYESAVEMFTSPHFEHLLDDVQRMD